MSQQVPPQQPPTSASSSTSSGFWVEARKWFTGTLFGVLAFFVSYLMFHKSLTESQLKAVQDLSNKSIASIAEESAKAVANAKHASDLTLKEVKQASETAMKELREISSEAGSQRDALLALRKQVEEVTTNSGSLAASVVEQRTKVEGFSKELKDLSTSLADVVKLGTEDVFKKAEALRAFLRELEADGTLNRAALLKRLSLPIQFFDFSNSIVIAGPGSVNWEASFGRTPLSGIASGQSVFVSVTAIVVAGKGAPADFWPTIRDSSGNAVQGVYWHTSDRAMANGERHKVFEGSGVVRISGTISSLSFGFWGSRADKDAGVELQSREFSGVVMFQPTSQ